MREKQDGDHSIFETDGSSPPSKSPDKASLRDPFADRLDKDDGVRSEP
jgi:hypothetical protein